MAIASSLTLFGNMIGPLAGGYIAGHFGIAASFIVNSCMLLTMGLVVWMYLSDDVTPGRHTAEPIDEGGEIAAQSQTTSGQP